MSHFFGITNLLRIAGHFDFIEHLAIPVYLETIYFFISFNYTIVPTSVALY